MMKNVKNKPEVVQKKAKMAIHKDILTLNTYYQYHFLQLKRLQSQYKKEKEAHFFSTPLLKQLKKEIQETKAMMVDLNKAISICSSSNGQESPYNLLFDLHDRINKKEVKSIIGSQSLLSNLSIVFVSLLSTLSIIPAKLFLRGFISESFAIINPSSFFALNIQRNKFWRSLINTLHYFIISL